MAGSSNPWNTKAFFTLCTNPFMRFPNAEPAECIRIGSYDTCTLTKYVRYLSLVMIAKWNYGLPSDCDIDCNIYGISQLSFPDSDERITSLNNLGNTVNIAPPVTVVVLDGVMVLIVAVVLI